MPSWKDKKLNKIQEMGTVLHDVSIAERFVFLFQQQSIQARKIGEIFYGSK